MKGLSFVPWGSRAILAGKKSMTRRIINPPKWWEGHYNYTQSSTQLISRDGGKLKQPRVKPGEIFYMKEIYGFRPDDSLAYKSNQKVIVPWRAPMMMPERFARMFLKCTFVKVERACDISKEDAIKEGMEVEFSINPVTAFLYEWEKINGPDTLEKLVWCIDFIEERRITSLCKNI
jgi:hypothetical protein